MRTTGEFAGCGFLKHSVGPLSKAGGFSTFVRQVQPEPQKAKPKVTYSPEVSVHSPGAAAAQGAQEAVQWEGSQGTAARYPGQGARPKDTTQDGPWQEGAVQAPSAAHGLIVQPWPPSLAICPYRQRHPLRAEAVGRLPSPMVQGEFPASAARSCWRQSCYLPSGSNAALQETSAGMPQRRHWGQRHAPAPKVLPFPA
jgi:hypothetical protein